MASKQSSERRATISLSPSPSRVSQDDEFASQQLLDETQASASKTAPAPASSPPPSLQASTVRSAHLLNAARSSKRRAESHDLRSSPPLQSSHVQGSRNTSAEMRRGKGGLVRPSFMAEDLSKKPRMNLSRRKDVYEVPDSPEKTNHASPYKLPERINHKPLKVVRGRKAKAKTHETRSKQPPESDALPSDPAQPNGDDNEALGIQAQKETIAQSSPHTTTNKRRSGRLAEKIVNGSQADLKRKPERPKRSGQVPQSKRSRKAKPFKRKQLSPVEENADAEIVQNEVILDSTIDGAPSNAIQGRRTRSTRNTVPEVRIPIIRRARQAGSEDDPNPDSNTYNTQERNDLIDQSDVPVSQQSGVEHGGTLESEDKVQDDAGEDLEEAEEEAQPSIEASVVDESELPEARKDAGPVSNLNRVFEFLDSEKRPGKCQTKLGSRIRKACLSSTRYLQRDETTVSDVCEVTNGIRGLLAKVRQEQDEDTRKEFKKDAYCFVFRDITLYLEGLYDWLFEKYTSIQDSTEAMRIITPLLTDMISFKQAIAYWKVQAQHSLKGDQIIMDVDEKLIVPLRKAEREYRSQLRELEAFEENQKIKDEIMQKRKEKLEARERQQEALEARQTKWRHWQDLHVWRQFCETQPNARRLRKLEISNFEDLEERDANGIPFERVPVFRERIDPPTYLAPAAPGEEWSDQQLSALIEGLTKFAGPYVFKKIFERYCYPGQVLRDFTVADITSKAAYMKFRLLRHYQNEGWEIPDWLTQIPILP